MSIAHYLRRAVSMPPHRAVAKAVDLVRRRIDQAHGRRRDSTQPTFSPPPRSSGRLVRYFGPPNINLLRTRRELLSELARRTCEHRFNLLGSGWVTVGYGAACRGVEGSRYAPAAPVTADREGRWLADRLNRANVPHARAVWQLVDPAYVPIDWQLDFKSGWRWSEQTWSKRIRYAHRRGVDVKVPWELARMQHLPWLAWAFALARGGEPGFEPAGVYLREFRNQVLDFIATNPPRFGVNWCCTMDVGIRVANWLVARDLFLAAGADFDEPFEQTFARSVRDHGRHITGHLEWSFELRSNHYLANIAGLLFAAAWLPTDDETNEWLTFAIREVVRETELQFTPDGANFEASTSYHRLSAEMIVWATAVALALPLDKQNVARRSLGVGESEAVLRSHLDRLERMAEFTMAATRPDGRIVQIGDNDGGRFLRLWPATAEAVEGPAGGNAHRQDGGRDHRHLIAAINGLADRADFAAFSSSAAFETQLVRSLRPRVAPRPGPVSRRSRPVFPDFGLYVLRNPRVWLAFRAGPVGQNGNGGHAHNDQLSIELCLDGVPFIVDPGTYLYTPSPDSRNTFRSTAVHSTLVLADREQNAWQPGAAGLFAMCARTRARVLRCEPREITAEHAGYTAIHRRTVRVTNCGIEGRDECDATGEKWIAFQFDPGVQVTETADGAAILLTSRGVRAILRSNARRCMLAAGAFSPTYGVMIPTASCRLYLRGTVAEWSITID